MQTLLVGLLVCGCALHAVWALMPGAARRAVARGVLRLGLPERLARPFQRAAGAGGGGCGGCDGCGDAGAVKTVRVHRRHG